MRRFLILLLATGLLASACAGDDSPPQADDDNPRRGGEEVIIDIDGDEIVLTSALAGFADCDALLDHLRTEGAERVGPYGFNEGWFGGGGPFRAVDVAEEATFATDDAVLDSDFSAAPVAEGGAQAVTLTEGVDFSRTNVQETGVDEADIVKTDGERVYIVANSELVVVDVATRSVIGSVALPSSDQAELFLHGDEILHITYGWWGSFVGPVIFDDIDAEAGFARGEGEIDEQFWDGPNTIVTRISVAGTTPRVLESMRVQGEYVSSRAVNGTARIVIRSNPQQSFPFVYPAGSAGEDRATESNREALMESELSDWLPGYTMLDANGSTTDSGLLPSCRSVHAPTEFAGFGVLSVLTVPVDGAIDPTANSSVLAPGSVVYSSPESIYVATTAWFDVIAFGAFDDSVWQEIQENRQTSIHRFDISSPSTVAYTASGSVPGDIRDSFSMSEHNGYLRVITTTGDPWSDNSETFVRILRETDGELVEVGSVGDMGRGEAVQSVRFQGDVGYVVTFEQVDPLYTLDLSDPQNPRLQGELKIPGFSSYLHPIGDGLVLGVGSDADEQTGRVTGTKVSLFDVNDLDNPQEISTWIGPDGWNNVGWDTHAFLWWAPENLAVVPMQIWEGGQNWSGVVVLEVVDREIREVGRIDHDDEDSVVRGQTECDTLGPEDLPSAADEFRTELEWMISDGSSLVLVCEEGESRSATGFECYPEPWISEEAAVLGIELDGEIVICWDNGDFMPTIARSIVLSGDELWTVSSPSGWLGGQQSARLQVNDLSSLERLDVIVL